MEKLKTVIRYLVSTEFLLKILIITAIFALMKISDGYFTLNLDHRHYGDLEIKVKKD